LVIHLANKQAGCKFPPI